MYSNKLYKIIDVWKKIEKNSAVRFRCFEIIGKNQFCVQNADFFHYPVDMNAIKSLDQQVIELFIEEFPDKRNKTYSSLEEAVTAHEKEFF